LKAKPKLSTAFPERGVSSFEGSEDEESDDSAVTVVETEERGKVKTREEVVVQQEIYDNWDNRGPRSLRWSRLNYTVKELVKYGYLKDSDTKNDEVLPFAIQRANEKIETVLNNLVRMERVSETVRDESNKILRGIEKYWALIGTRSANLEKYSIGEAWKRLLSADREKSESKVAYWQRLQALVKRIVENQPDCEKCNGCNCATTVRDVKFKQGLAKSIKGEESEDAALKTLLLRGEMSDKELHELLIEYAKSNEETAPTGKKKVDKSALGFAAHREGKGSYFDKGKCFACGSQNHFLGECKDKKKLEKYKLANPEKYETFKNWTKKTGTSAVSSESNDDKFSFSCCGMSVRRTRWTKGR